VVQVCAWVVWGTEAREGAKRPGAEGKRERESVLVESFALLVLFLHMPFSPSLRYCNTFFPSPLLSPLLIPPSLSPSPSFSPCRSRRRCCPSRTSVRSASVLCWSARPVCSGDRKS